ncbi:hypothetical protein QL285_074307 [Trifolium repens]|nr:hypothetical protein QL285_074307 [Trifolium repens]
MTDRGYNNFYTPDDLQEESIKAKQVSNCELCDGDHPTGHCPPMTDVQFAQMIKQMANKQSMKVQTNTQTTHEKDNILKRMRNVESVWKKLLKKVRKKEYLKDVV